MCEKALFDFVSTFLPILLSALLIIQNFIIDLRNKKLQKEIHNRDVRLRKIKYRDKCYHCSRDKYDKKLSEIEKTEKSAKEKHDYFYSLVNNYNDEIDRRVEKIVKKKTRLQRFADWLETFISAINSAVFFVPFLYAVVTRKSEKAVYIQKYMVLLQVQFLPPQPNMKTAECR